MQAINISIPIYSTLVDAHLPIDEQQPFYDLLDLLQKNLGETGRRPFNIKNPLHATPSLHLCPAMQVFFDAVSHEIRSLNNHNKMHDNVTTQERLALKQLSERHDVIIKEADKDGNIVLWPLRQHVKEYILKSDT